MKQSFVLNLRHVSGSGRKLVGAKAASLGLLLGSGLPVPAGFVVTTQAYQQFLKLTNLSAQLRRILDESDLTSDRKLPAAAARLQKAILRQPIPEILATQIETSYRELTHHEASQAAVAVRVSSPNDLPNLSTSHELATFLEVVGLPAVLRAIQHCWAAQFDARALAYARAHQTDLSQLETAVMIQQMVEPMTAGVLQTTDPDDPETLLIEAVYGSGEAVVLGTLTPDRYHVRKSDGTIISQTLHPQSWELAPSATKPGSFRHQTVPKNRQRHAKLSSADIKQLTALAAKVEAVYEAPQTIEWAIDRAGHVWLLDAHLAIAPDSLTIQAEPGVDQLLFQAVGGTVGVATGPVRIIHKPSQLDSLKPGEILVTELTTPALIATLPRAAAIITETGGVTSHAVVAARELGIPCVVGAGTAISTLQNGLIVTVDADSGRVYQGTVVLHPTTAHDRLQAPLVDHRDQLITGTKVLVNLGSSTKVETIAALPVDGVGLIRAEFMFAGLGMHPRYLLEEQKDQLFVRKLVDGIRTIAAAFAPRPVIYRTSDLKTNEYRHLEGGEKVEPRESNPMLGYRGALRYIREPELFNLELQALKTVRDSYNLTNVSLMIPFVRTPEELRAVKVLVDQAGLTRDHDFKLWMMAELPANVFVLEDFLAVGIDGVSIGSNDLTQLILGVDRDNAKLATSFDERHPAVLDAMTHIVRVCRKQHVAVSICGQAASTYPEVAEALIEAGITSLSVDPDAALAVRQLVASIERRIILDRLTQTAHGDPHPLWR